MEHKKETSPDELLDTFKGRSLTSIVVFTVVVHALVLIGSSVPFLLENVLGEDNSQLTEEQRVQLAAKKATSALREIAEEYDIKPQDLSSQMAGGTRRPAQTESTPAPETTDPQTTDPETTGPETTGPETTGPETTGPEPAPEESERPKSAIEEEMEKVEEGPALPPIPKDEEDDLFR